MTDLLPHYRRSDEIEDSREAVPDLEQEIRRTIDDLIRGDDPTTTLGVLLQARFEALRHIAIQTKLGMKATQSIYPGEALTGPAIVAKIIGSDFDQVEWVLDELEQAGLILTVKENGLEKYITTAPTLEPTPDHPAVAK